MIKSVKKNNNNNLDSSHTSHTLLNTKITFFKYNNNFINEILSLEKKEKYYWFAAYDKLIKKVLKELKVKVKLRNLNGEVPLKVKKRMGKPKKSQ